MVNLLQNRILNITEEFRRGTFTQRCSQLSFGILCLFLLECSITGGGRYWEVGPVSVRILLGGLAAVLALPELFRHLGAYLKKPAVWLTLAFVGWLAFCAWRGVRAENRMDVLLTDIKGFMWLFLVPVLVATVRSRQRLRVLLSWVLAGALIQAALILAVPVGFVNVVESKEEILALARERGIPAIAALGRKGGSTVAAALCNALLYQSGGREKL